MEKNLLKKIILDQQESFNKEEKYFKREINLEKYMSSEPIIIISGVRRSGKSTLLKIIRDRLNKKETAYLYLDFSDDRLNDFKLEDFQIVYEIFLEEYKNNQKVFFFDEIQYIKGWEKFVNRLYEKEKAKVYVTGSNSSLLSSEISTVLTGRNKVIKLYPLSFKEYIQNNDINLKKITTKEEIKINKLYQEYENIGGFPYVLRTKDTDILSEYFTNILNKDIIIRKNIRQVKEIKEIILYLTNNVGQIISYKQIINNSKIKSTSTVKNFIDYFSEVYLLFTLSKYDSSIRKQIQNPKKIYFIDQGLVNKINLSNTENKGWLLENIVYLELIKKEKEVYYHKNNTECDFIIKSGKNITHAIQVTYYLSDKNKEREVKGLVSAMKHYNLKKGTIITRDKEEKIKIENYEIDVIPIYKWCLIE